MTHASGLGVAGMGVLFDVTSIVNYPKIKIYANGR
jgi:hypothetical protein